LKAYNDGRVSVTLDAEATKMGEWECMECGYVEVGMETQPPRECPGCGAPSQALEFFPLGDDQDASYDEATDDLTDDLDLDAMSGEDEDLRSI
jgi:hypothetical protein